MKKLRLFQRQLPPTTSQIAAAANLLRRKAETAQLGDLEAFLLAAIAESALSDGELRTALEQILGRSLHFAALDDVARDEILAAAERRANQMRHANPGPWLTVVYRTGLRTSTCDEIRNHLSSRDLSPFAELGQEFFLSPPSKSPSEILTMLLTEVLLGLPELGWPAPVAWHDRAGIVDAWLAGTTAEEFVAAISDVNAKMVQRCFDAISRHGPWLVGASIEIVGHLSNLDHSTRIRIHSALELDRLRSGTPSVEASALVAEGFEREDAAELWAIYQASGKGVAFSDWVERVLAEDEADAVERH